MKKPTKRFWSILVGCIIIVSLISTIVLVFALREPGMKVRAIGESTTGEAAEYRDSRLFLHRNGGFDIQIIYLDYTVFTAIGTYTRDRNQFTFTFRIVWSIDGADNYTLNSEYINHIETFQRIRGRIQFIDHNRNTYYFR